ncbi:hypothetical protein ACQ4PT_009096 [Festuca glaucescens]
MRDPSDIRSLPIDIAFARLQEWLVDRKRVPHDWRKRLAASAPASPPPLPPSRGTFTPTSSPSSSKGEWESIAKAYEKDHIFLGEAAQIMVQNVNYDMYY